MAATTAVVDVYLGGFGEPDAGDQYLLSADEVARYARITRAEPRARFLAGRVLLRRALAARAGVSAEAVHIEILEDGRLQHESVAGISLSHSGGLVACALANAPIGIDVQMTGTGHDTAAIAAAGFQPEEQLWLEDRPRDAFYQLWALKEAWLKASGRGLAGGLDSVCCRIDPPGLGLEVDGCEAGVAALWQLPGAVLAVVVPGTEIEVTRNSIFGDEVNGVELLAESSGWRA
jgi:phosphopantetheinyl transferase